MLPKMRSTDRACVVCERSEDEVRLYRCFTCREWFCRSCEVRRYGRTFCSKNCAALFFFGEEE